MSTEMVWRELSDRLRAFIHSRIQKTAETEDLLQEVFLRVHKKLDTIQRPERIESWVFQIARNTLIDFFRRADPKIENRPRSEIDSVTEIESSMQRDDANINVQVAGWLPMMINTLPEKLRRSVSLYEIEGWSQKQIASELKIGLPAVKSRIQRGRKQLERIIRDCCELQFDRRGNVIGCEPMRQTGCEFQSCDCS